MHRIKLFDTHTHFDVPDFDHDRVQLAQQAKAVGVEGVVLIGFLHSRFNDLIQTQHFLNQLENAPKSYLAPGLHPFFIDQHETHFLQDLEHILKTEDCVAVGEIGLDNFKKEHKQPEVFKKQQEFFSAQFTLEKKKKKPVLLHILRSHADAIKILKQHKFQYGGIAHAFSGGVQEAKALIAMGFKIGVTGQITNPNAKKLHTVVKEIGLEHLVLETDCPDMTPLCCQTSHEHRTRNTPANLPYVLDGLTQVLGIPRDVIAAHLWQNTMQALRLEND